MRYGLLEKKGDAAMAKKATAEKSPPKGKFRLLVGKHYARDYTAKPIPVLDAAGKVALDPMTDEKVMRYPPKEFTAGQIVEAEIDLVETFGADRFAYVGEPPKDEDKLPVPTRSTHMRSHVNPSGAVSEGHQMTTGKPDGSMSAGVADERAMGLENEAQNTLMEERAAKAASTTHGKSR